MAKINDRAVFISSLNKTLKQAITDGNIGAMPTTEKFKDQSFDVAIAASSFAPTQTFTDNKIDVWVNGMKQRENSDYVRNVPANSIDFNTSIPVNAWIEIRIWL